MMKNCIRFLLLTLFMQASALFAADPGAATMQALMQGIHAAMGKDSPQVYLRRLSAQRHRDRALRKRRVRFESSSDASDGENEATSAQKRTPPPVPPSTPTESYADATAAPELPATGQKDTVATSAAADAVDALEENPADYASEYEELTPSGLTTVQEADQVAVPRGMFETTLNDPTALIAYLDKHTKDINHRRALDEHIRAALDALQRSHEVGSSWDSLDASMEVIESMSRLSELASKHRLKIDDEQRSAIFTAEQAHHMAHKAAEREALGRLAGTRISRADEVDGVTESLRHLTTKSAANVANTNAVEQATEVLAQLLGDTKLTPSDDVAAQDAQELLQIAHDLLATRRRKQVPINPVVLREIVENIAALKAQMATRKQHQEQEALQLDSETNAVLAQLQLYAQEHVARQQGLVDLGEGSGVGLVADDERDATA